MNYNTKPIKIPPFCEDLAEETGVHIGDGCLHIHKRGTSYYYEITANASEDKDYITYLIKKIKKLYNIKPSITSHKKTNTKTITYFSKNPLEFKYRLGLPLGPKKDIKIPNWIISNNKFITACIRGITDTDGTVGFKKKYKRYHYYPIVSICSTSRPLIYQLASQVLKLGIPLQFITLDIEKMKNGIRCGLFR